MSVGGLRGEKGYCREWEHIVVRNRAGHLLCDKRRSFIFGVWVASWRMVGTAVTICRSRKMRSAELLGFFACVRLILITREGDRKYGFEF